MEQEFKTRRAAGNKRRAAEDAVVVEDQEVDNTSISVLIGKLY